MFRALASLVSIGILFVSIAAIAGTGPALAQSEALLGHFKRYSSLEKAGKYVEALPFAQKALALSEQELGEGHKTTSILLYNVADLYRRLGKYRTARPLFERSLANWERLHGKNDPSLERYLVRLGYVSRFAADYQSAEHYYKRYQKLVESYDPPKPEKISTALNNLAGLYRELGRYQDAEPLYLKAIKLTKDGLPKRRKSLAIMYDNLGVLYRERGRYDEAEKLHKQALVEIQATVGLDHLDAGHIYNNLGSLYLEQGRYRAAEPMMERAVEVFRKVYGAQHPRLGFAHDNLAGIKRHLGKLGEAEQNYKKALEIVTASLHKHHPDVALALNNLSMLYIDKREFKKALPLQLRALEISRKVYGGRHANIAFQLSNLGDLYRDLKDLPAAERHYEEAVEVTKQVFGPDHPLLGKRLSLRASLWMDMGRADAALADFQAAARIYTNRWSNAGSTASAAIEQKRQRRLFEELGMAAWQVAEKSAPGRRDELSDIAFQAAQRAQQTAASAALAQVAARFGAGTDALAVLVREHQDLSSEQRRVDEALTKSLSLPPAKRDAKREEALRRQFDGIAKRLDNVEQQLTEQFPDYAELSNPKPMSTADMQKLLKPGEAAVQFQFSGYGGLAWLITPERVRWVSLALNRAGLATRVSDLRFGLSSEAGEERTDWAGLPFDLMKSHELYRLLLGQFDDGLAGIRHLYFIPTAALTALPPAVLVTEAPEQRWGDFVALRKVPWLIRKFAISVLPSAASLRAVRSLSRRPTSGRAPFAGIGDPVLSGPKPGQPGSEQRSAGHTSNTGNTAQPVKQAKLTKLFRGSIADVRAVRDLVPLPDTSDELKSIAAILNAKTDALYLRERASEAVVKQAGLDRYRIVAFATHGLIAGDLAGVAEPSLVLTPPEIGTREDDGLLTASEVAQLKLDADWVLLSACNTAAGDGRPGAEGLSGLARAFFYSGERAMLVSHWPVLSHAAVKLTTGAFAAMKEAEAARRPIGRAEALRRSMLALMNDEEHLINAHPETWAPFVLVGEGSGVASLAAEPFRGAPRYKICKQPYHVRRGGECVDVR